MRHAYLLLALWTASLGVLTADDGRPAIAVARFDGPDQTLARLITETVTQDLAASGRLRLVERGQIQQAEEEIGLGQMGIVNPATAPELGRMVGAQQVVIGSFDIVGSVLSLRARLVEVATGEIVGGAAASVEGNIAGQASDIFLLAHLLANRFHHRLTGEWLPLEVTLDPRADPTTSLDPGRQSIAVSVSVDRGEGSTYLFGEPVVVTFSSNADGYVRLYNIDSAGKVTPLYPNDWTKRAPIEAGRTYTIPPRGAGWRLSAEGIPGQEVILAIVTERPVDFPQQRGFNDFVGKSVVPRLSEGSSRWGMARVHFYTDVTEERMPAVTGKYVYIPVVKGLPAKGLDDGPAALLEDGHELLLIGEPREARDKFAQALDLTPDLAPAWLGLGVATYSLAQQEEAAAAQGFGSGAGAQALYAESLAAFQRAAELGLEDPTLLYNLGVAFLALGRAEEGVRRLQQFVTVQTDPYDDLVMRAKALLEEHACPEDDS